MNLVAAGRAGGLEVGGMGHNQKRIREISGAVIIVSFLIPIIVSGLFYFIKIQTRHLGFVYFSVSMLYFNKKYLHILKSGKMA